MVTFWGVPKKWMKLTIVMAIVLTVYHLATRESEEFRNERKNVAQYLREKYGQEFIIQKVEYHTPSLGATRRIETHVLSQEKEPVKLIVSRIDDGSDVEYIELCHRMGDMYSGSYLSVKWERELERSVKEMAAQIYSQPVNLYVDLSLRRKNFGRVPSYFEILQSNPELFEDKYTTQAITLIFFYTITEKNQLVEAEKLFRFITALQQSGIKYLRIEAEYFSSDYEGQGQNNINKYGVRVFDAVEGRHYYMSGYDVSNKKQSYILVLKEDVPKVKDATDLLKYLKIVPGYK